MKKSPKESALMNNLKASKFSAQGFVGNDTRAVDEIIAADERKLDRLGISVEQVAQALAAVHERAQEAFGAEIEIQAGVSASYFESRGKIPSPFIGDGVFDKGETILRDKKSGAQVIITALGIALIEKHHFFQGLGSRYRMDPATLVKLLNLTPD